MSFEPISVEDDEIAHEVVGAAIEVHRELGPGYSEKLYEHALVHELKLRKLAVQTQQQVVVTYKGLQLPEQYLDVMVGGRVIVELKAVDQLHPIHDAQVISYLKATKLRLGLLLNFNIKLMKDGIKRIAR